MRACLRPLRVPWLPHSRSALQAKKDAIKGLGRPWRQIGRGRGKPLMEVLVGLMARAFAMPEQGSRNNAGKAHVGMACQKGQGA